MRTFQLSKPWMWFSVIMLIIVIGLWLSAGSWLDAGLLWINLHPQTAWLVFIVIYVIAALLMMPVVALSIPAGALFGFGPGLVIVWVASVSSSMLAMLAARTVLREHAQKILQKKRRFLAVERAVTKNGFVTVLLSRLSLVLPFVVMNYVFSVTQVRVRDYFLATIIGILPSKVLYVYTGFIARDLSVAMQTGVSFNGYGILVLIVGLLATIVMIILLSRAANQYLEEET